MGTRAGRPGVRGDGATRAALPAGTAGTAMGTTGALTRRAAPLSLSRPQAPPTTPSASTARSGRTTTASTSWRRRARRCMRWWMAQSATPRRTLNACEQGANITCPKGGVLSRGASLGPAPGVRGRACPAARTAARPRRRVDPRRFLAACIASAARAGPALFPQAFSRPDLQTLPLPPAIHCFSFARAG
jgi:hypothetical protein